MVVLEDPDKERAELRRFANEPAPARRRPSTETLPPYRPDDDDLSSESSVSATTTNLLNPSARLPLSPPLTPASSPRPPLNTSHLVQETPRDAPPSPSGAPIAPKHPVNYMTVSGNNGSIRGTYHIDPALTIPIARPPSEGNIRPNLFLKCTNGLIKVEVRVLPPARHTPKLPRCLVKLDATNGSISARIPNPGHAISIHLTIANGSAHLRLPRSFTGPLITTLRTSALGASSSLASRLTVLSDPGMSTSRTRHAFVGDYRGANWTRVSKSWNGDEVILEGTNASVRISYVDDPEDVKLVGSGQWQSILGSVM